MAVPDPSYTVSSPADHNCVSASRAVSLSSASMLSMRAGGEGEGRRGLYTYVYQSAICRVISNPLLFSYKSLMHAASLSLLPRSVLIMLLLRG